VRVEPLSGRLELGLQGTDGSDGNVTTRKIFGVWDFGPASLKIGKDYGPAHQFVSGQVFDLDDDGLGDDGLLGNGFAYSGRPGQIALNIGRFIIALITPKTRDLTTADGTGSTATGDIDTVIPKIEASWDITYDAFSFKLIGGYNFYKIEDAIALAGGTEDIDVSSYIIGADASYYFGPAYIRTGLSYTRNGGNAGWEGNAATWDGDGDSNDNDTLMAGLVAGVRVGDMLSFEAGAGYRQDDPKDAAAGFDNKQKQLAYYFQSVIMLAPGVYLIPEVGYLERGDNAKDEDLGNKLYYGAKWQIDF